MNAPAVIERISPGDAQNLAADRGRAPWNIAALLVLDGEDPFDLDAAREELGRRLPGVPRLRQRLWRVPFVLGRAVWVDHPAFDIAEHVVQLRCRAPADDRALLDTVAEIVTRRLPAQRPLWSLTFITEIDGRPIGALVVMHHVLADGVGGLAVLAALVDGTPPPEPVEFPRRVPSRWALLADAGAGSLRALRQVPAAVGLVVRALAGVRAVRRVRPARTSLNRPTGSSRRLFVARADLGALKDVAHHHGATLNDVVLTAVGGALQQVLLQRGEHPGSLVASVPVAGRPTTDAQHLGNQVGVMPIDLCIDHRNAGERLVAISRLTRVARTADVAATAAVVNGFGRAVGALRLTRLFTEHQRLVNTFVTNVRGPAVPLHLLRRRVVDIVAVPPTTGNIPVSFGAFSYAGSVVITVVTDPQAAPDGADVAAALCEQLGDFAANRHVAGTHR
jgi:diacylglycerol O-acyltransferase / wax synthase